MRLRLCWTAAFAATVLTGAAFADVTVSQSNDPTSMIEGEFASLFGAEHQAVAAVPAPRLQALASGPEAANAAASQAAVSAGDSPSARASGGARLTGVQDTSAQPADAVATDQTAFDPPAAPRIIPTDRAEGTAPSRWRFRLFGGKDDVPPPVLIRYDLGWLNSQPEPDGDAQWQCLRRAIYFESRGETLKGQFAVAEVILNRVDSPRYPKTICGVVQQTCQFSYTCDGQSDRMSDAGAADVAGRIARVMMDGAPRALTMGATHFHTPSVRPDWANRFPRTASIGAHLFYRQP